MPRATKSNLGRRILVYGVTGSGKSTAAQRIAARTHKLSAASRNTDGLFMLIDGALWFRPLTGPGC